jgi:hypothetical protein
MKTEDIDKRIGMPDVDTEWARFEREVIDKSAVSHKKVWLWGLSIAASIILVAGLFFFNQDIKEPGQLLAEQEAPLATEGTEASAATIETVGKPVVEPPTVIAPIETPRTQESEEEFDEPMQGQIAGLEAIDPNYSDSILVLLDGKRLPDSLCTLHFARRGIHPYLEKKGLRVGKMVRLSGEILSDEILSNEVFGKDESERAKQRYAGYIERYGELAWHGVAEITSANDSANEVFILQHPELQRTHRRVEGYVVEQETNEPCGYTYIYYRRYNTSADSLGHFVLWVPKSADSLCAKWVGSKSVYFPPADSILTIRLKDNIFGELKNLFPPKR